MSVFPRTWRSSGLRPPTLPRLTSDEALPTRPYSVLAEVGSWALQLAKGLLTGYSSSPDLSSTGSPFSAWEGAGERRYIFSIVSSPQPPCHSGRDSIAVCSQEGKFPLGFLTFRDRILLFPECLASSGLDDAEKPDKTIQVGGYTATGKSLQGPLDSSGGGSLGRTCLFSAALDTPSGGLWFL